MSTSIQKYPLVEPLERIYRHDILGFYQPKLGELIDDSTGRDKRYTMVKQGDHLSILASYHNVKTHQYYCDQFDFPLKILSWFPWALEEFRKPPSEGGLHTGAMISKDMDVDGEMLAVGSATDGYDITNRSRNDRENDNEPEYYEPIRLSLSWEFLYKRGFLDLWKELGQKYERGELDYLLGDL